jgi:uncharacterized protein YjbJ (UPF0337 family)
MLIRRRPGTGTGVAFTELHHDVHRLIQIEVIHMNWDQVKGNWKQVKGEVKSRWGELTDDDLTEIEGERDKLVGKVQERYGIAKDEAERQVDEMQLRHTA